MDELELFLGGSQKPTAPGVINDQLLDSLRKTESGKDRFALNKETKAMGPYQFMPETVQMLHKQGIEFNPFNEQEARGAAKTYLERLVKQNNGDVNKALAQYGGFVTKDPSQYVNKVLQGQQTAQPADDLEAFLSGGKPAQQPVQVAPSTAGAGRGSYAGYNPQEAAQAIGESTRGEPAQGGTAIGRAAAQLLGKAMEARRNLGERVVGAIDTAYGVVPAAYGAALQATARLANTPERAEEIGKLGEQSIAQPVGKALGITGKETYQKPLGGMTEPVREQVKNMAEKLGLTAKQISEKTGIPEQDIRNMALTGSFALPQVFKEVTPAAKQVAGVVTKPIREAAAELQVAPRMTPAEAQAQFDALQNKTPLGSVGAAKTEHNPYFGQITGEERGGSETFPQVKLSKIPKDVPMQEQQLRSQLFQEVLPGLKPRPGVVTGNDNLLRNEHALASMAEPTPLGMKMKEQIANEQIGLSKFAEDRVDATGASRKLLNDEQRGELINDVFHGVNPEDVSGSSIVGYLNQAKKTIYDSAFNKVGNNQIKTTHVDDLLKNPQWAAGLKIKGVEGVQSAAKEYLNLAKTVGFEDINGVMHPPGSVAAYDAVRKAINADWTPQNANAIRRVNQAIDKDIAAVADPTLYKFGDKIHEVEKTIFGSKGIKTLFGEMDKNGVITSSTPLEKIPSKLNNLPKDQWRHIRDTLNELSQGRIRNAPEGMPPVPQELQNAARAAVAEIDGSLAREVYKAGASNVGEWSSKKANNVMNSTIGQKIVETFPPDEVQKFHALNYVGQFTPGLKYEGAALQQRRIGLLEKGAPGIGAATGAAVGGFLGEGNPLAVGGGAFIGREIGTKVQSAKATKAETKAVKKMEKEMQKASEIGKQSGKNKISDLGK